ncbi:MAG TPA: hypothetical protein VGE52_20385 [Pirellulales bacterium]
MASQTGQDWIDPADYFEKNVGWNKFVDAVLSQRYRGRLLALRLDPTPRDGWLGDSEAADSQHGFVQPSS